MKPTEKSKPDIRVFNSTTLSPQRLPNESQEAYNKRRKLMNKAVRQYSGGFRPEALQAMLDRRALQRFMERKK